MILMVKAKKVYPNAYYTVIAKGTKYKIIVNMHTGPMLHVEPMIPEGWKVIGYYRKYEDARKVVPFFINEDKKR